EAMAVGNDRLPAGESPDAQLGPLQIAQHRDRAVEFLLERADRLDRPAVNLVIPVAQVDAEGVGAGPEQPAQHVRVAAGRSDGGEDLDLAGPRFELCRHAAAPYGKASPQHKDVKCRTPPIRSTRCPTMSPLPRSAAWCDTCAIATTRRTST